jgi:hypothetical protein
MKNPNLQKTMLTEWFTANQQYEKAHELTYCEFPTKWTWDQKIVNGMKESMVSKLVAYIM